MTSWARFRQNRAAMVGLGLVALLLAFAWLGPLLTPWRPDQSDFALRRGPLGAPPGPSAAHWLGVDHLFRDVFARLAQGARLSLAVAVAATALASFIGAVIGLTAGMAEGTRFSLVDTLLMRLVDVLLALPFLLIVTAIGVAVGHTDTGTVLLVLGLVGWTGAARLVRARTMQLRALDFVTAARALGASPLGVVARHVVPNLAGTLIVVATTSVGQMILAEAVLGYLTVGIQPPFATWGRMLHESEPHLETRLALVAIPGFAILLAVLGFSRIGDGLRDALGAEAEARRGAAPSRFPADLLLTAAALLLLSIVRPGQVSAPTGPAPQHDTPRRGGVLHLAAVNNARTLDPALASDEIARVLSDMAFARLLTWDEQGRLAADLVERWTVSPDGLRYRFDLREGAFFHDGKPVLARHVKRSFERLLHPKTPSPGASMYSALRGFDAYHDGKSPELPGVLVEGERALVMELSQPDASFLSKLTLAFAAPVCPSASAVADPRDTALPCGAGPFRYTFVDTDKGVRLARHEGYHLAGKPYLDGVEWIPNVGYRALRHRLERGEVDYTHELAGADRDRFEASPAWAGQHRWEVDASTFAVFLNTELPPFDRRPFRRAVAHALDPRALAVMRADVAPADRIVPPSIPGPAHRPPMRVHDLTLALREMAEAGYPFDPATGRGGYPEPIDYLAVADTGDQQHAEVWQQQLARIGVRLRLRLVTWATFLAEVTRRKTARMGNTGWTADFPDPSNFFESLHATSAIQDEGSQNVAFLSNPELDKLLDLAHADADPARRLARYERAEEILRDEAAWIPTLGPRVFEIWQPWVRNYRHHAVQRGRIHDVWIDRSPAAPLSPLGRRP